MSLLWLFGMYQTPCSKPSAGVGCSHWSGVWFCNIWVRYFFTCELGVIKGVCFKVCSSGVGSQIKTRIHKEVQNKLKRA